LDATSNNTRSHGGTETKVKQELGLKIFEIDTIGYLVENSEGKEVLDFLGQGKVHSRFQTLFIENSI